MSEVRRLWIPGPAGRLEALVRVAAPAVAVAVVGHPHPLHGGTMHNPVVFHSDRELHRSGWTTLRFNFRGVGESEGEHGDGRHEPDDVAAASTWARGLAPDAPQVYVGYSFGSWCGYRYLLREPVLDGFVAIGLPVLIHEFADMAHFRVPIAVVQGERDEFGRPDDVRAVLDLARSHAELHVVPDAGHLFPRRGSEVGRRVTEAARKLIEPRHPHLRRDRLRRGDGPP